MGKLPKRIFIRYVRVTAFFLFLNVALFILIWNFIPLLLVFFSYFHFISCSLRICVGGNKESKAAKWSNNIIWKKSVNTSEVISRLRLNVAVIVLINRSATTMRYHGAGTYHGCGAPHLKPQKPIIMFGFNLTKKTLPLISQMKPTLYLKAKKTHGFKSWIVVSVY